MNEPVYPSPQHERLDVLAGVWRSVGAGVVGGVIIKGLFHMRKVKLEMQVSVDGFTADEDGKADWMLWAWTDEWAWDEALRHYHTELTTSSDCILLSRKMAEEGFHAHWEQVAEDPANPQFAFAKPITDMHKLVFSKTLGTSIWPRTDVAGGILEEEIGRLKSKEGKDIIVYGGPTLASSLINAGLIDEFHLFINPTALGRGRSMFKDINAQLDLTLASATPFECGIVVLKYVRGKFA